MIPRSALPAICLIVASVMATAQTQAAQTQAALPAASPELAAVLATPQHRGAVLEAAKHSTTWLRHPCDSASFTPLVKVSIWHPVSFNDAHAPVSGQWGESVQASGCGLTRTLNVVTTVKSADVVATGPLAPGATTADPLLQLDAARYAFTAASTHVPDCKQAFLDDTETIRTDLANPSNAQQTGPTRIEHWTINMCGQSVAVELAFIPDATGTSISAHVL